ncbi:hypothetical protein [Desulfobulbus sp.]|uniref:hypothetical protein n=1 Tax=Desulfobulbus sp. TaxID=895 RepID=UPI00286F5DB0|nr:hypothetical protein [Desulfobulbus sp.]
MALALNIHRPLLKHAAELVQSHFPFPDRHGPSLAIFAAVCAKVPRARNIPLDGYPALQVMKKQYFIFAPLAQPVNHQENMKISYRNATSYVCSLLLVVDVVVVVRAPIGAP